MANSNGWGDGAGNNAIGWGKGASNAIGWGDIHADSWAGLTDIVGTPAFDSDAQAFITAAAITDPTQQAAINTLVVDLKGYNVWSKMKALYPFVGGTAAQHKWNLKDPRDLDAAFRLVFNGGWTHSSNGALPNGTNGWANTYLVSQGTLALNSTHVSVYSRTNTNALAPAIGNVTGGVQGEVSMWLNFGNAAYLRVNSASVSNTLNFDSRGMFIGNRVNSTQVTLSIRGTQTTFSQNSDNLYPQPIQLGGVNPNNFDNKQLAFSSIGDGLTAQNMTDLTTAVQTFQTTLGRSIGTQTVSDADAQAFVTNAGIVDQVEANAINNLVIGMKADGTWSKMKAVYPFVGGTATTNKFNLVNPLDTDAAFRLVFNGGWTFSSNGALPNGTNAYADTKFATNLFTSASNFGIGSYTRTNTTSGAEIGVFNPDQRYIGSNLTNAAYFGIGTGFLSASNTDSRGFWQVHRTSSSVVKVFKNASVFLTGTTGAGTLNTREIFIGALNDNGAANFCTAKEIAFSFISDGLTDTEATNLRTAVQAFQVALSRNI